MSLHEAMAQIFAPEQIKPDEPLSLHTTMRVGGPADVMVCPSAPEQVLQALSAAKSMGAPCLILGNGSNLIARDGGFRGLVILMAGLSKIESDGCMIRAQAGATLPAVSAEALKRGLGGLEFASGIPGSVGGACAMNAGAYGEQISDALTRARVWMDERDQWLTSDQLEMGYRSTRILKRGGLVLEAEFALQSKDPAAIRQKMDQLNQQRRDKQPLNLPNAGSTFKRPEGHFAGALIESAGLKGTRVGQAQVSEKHAGFIVNLGGASAKDVLCLIEFVQQKVLDTHGVMLEREVRVVGED